MITQGFCCKSFFIIIITIFSHIYPLFEIQSMETESSNPLSSFLDSDEQPSFLKDLSQLPIDASTQTEEDSQKVPEKIAQTIPVHQFQHYLKNLKPDHCVAFLGGNFFFILAEDLSSNIGTRRVLAYDLWRTVQGKKEEMLKRLIISFESLSNEKISYLARCFDFAQHSENVPDTSHTPANTILTPPYSAPSTVIRQLLANELMSILLLLNYKTKMVCAKCSQPILNYNQDAQPSNPGEILLLKCMHIYHLGCAKVPLNEKIDYACPYCKTAIDSEDDYVLYKKQI
jgi:hypothetical protein